MIDLLDGRLEIRGFKGTAAPPREYDVMWTAKAQAQETRTMVAAGDDRFVVLADELFQLAPSAFEEEAKKYLGYMYGKRVPQPRFEALKLASGLRNLAMIPAAPKAQGDAATMLAMLVVHPDGTLQDISLHVSPQLAAENGCMDTARALAETLRPAARKLDRKARTETLSGGGLKLKLALPADCVVTEQPGPDFTAFHVNKLAPLGQYPGEMLVYIGGHPDTTKGEKVHHRGKLLGAPVEWSGPADGGELRAVTKVDAHNFVAVNISGKSDAFSSEMRAVAESLAK
jgi:hypothetical protein